jgi:hypothetical protein
LIVPTDASTQQSCRDDSENSVNSSTGMWESRLQCASNWSK